MGDGSSPLLSTLSRIGHFPIIPKDLELDSWPLGSWALPKNQLADWVESVI